MRRRSIGPPDLDHLHPAFEQDDGGFEQVVEQGVGQQPRRRIVGGGDERDAPSEEGAHGTRDEHAVADVVDVELVEAQHAGVADRGIDGVVDRAESMRMRMQGGEEAVEVVPSRGHGHRLEKPVHQPRLAPADRPPQVDARRGGPPGSEIATEPMQRLRAGALVRIVHRHPPLHVPGTLHV